MAYQIKKSDITTNQRQFIQKSLKIIPVKDNYFNPHAIVTPIYFYLVKGNIAIIPYSAASEIFDLIPNDTINHTPSAMIYQGQLRDYQIPIYNEAISHLQSYGTTTLNLFTGCGKTQLSIKLATTLGFLTLVLVNRILLLEQWSQSFNKSTNAHVWIVGEQSMPDRFDVIICLDTRWNLIDDKIKVKIGTVLIDEAHLFCTPSHVECLLAFYPKFVIAMSATLERDDQMHHMIYAICGEHGIYRESNIKFSVIKYNTRISPKTELNSQGKIDFGKLQNDLLMNEQRNTMIVNLVNQYKDEKILILTKLVKHVHMLHKLIKNHTTCDFLCGKKTHYIDRRVLIGTTHKIGTGFDQEACPTFDGIRFNLLILVCSIKKYQMLVQNVGRVLRCNTPTVIHFVDDHFVIQKHWSFCEKWYKKRQAEIKVVNVNDLLL